MLREDGCASPPDPDNSWELSSLLPKPTAPCPAGVTHASKAVLHPFAPQLTNRHSRSPTPGADWHTRFLAVRGLAVPPVLSPVLRPGNGGFHLVHLFQRLVFRDVAVFLDTEDVVPVQGSAATRAEAANTRVSSSPRARGYSSVVSARGPRSDAIPPLLSAGMQTFPSPPAPPPPKCRDAEHGEHKGRGHCRGRYSCLNVVRLTVAVQGSLRVRASP